MTPAEIAAALGFAPDALVPMGGGVANEAYALGPDLVLRVPRSADFVADLRKEAEILPLVVAAGVRTAELVAAGPNHLVTRRLHGVESASAAWETGRELAKLHRITDVPPSVPVDEPADPHALLDRLATDGWIDAGAACRLGEWFTRLAVDEPPQALVHGDIAPQNLLVGASGELAGLIDWGDAALGDPATDFAKLPFAQVPAALRGYREAGAADFPWEQRVLWHRLLWSLGRLENPAPRPGERHWSAPPAARLLDLLFFFAAGPPPPWPSLAPAQRQG